MEEEYREFEAKTVDEAIVAAMRTFRSNFENLDIQVISEGSKGLFGLVGTKTAKILARPARKDTETTELPEQEVSAPAKPAPREPETAEKEKILGQASRIISDILTRMNMSCEIKIREEGTIEIVGDGSGLIIGKRGQTLDALQFIVNRILNKDRSEPLYVTIDTEGYRQRHMDLLRSMAFKMGQKARRTGQSVSLEKMNPYDRRIIHLALKNDNRVNTKSIGDGVYKKVVIVPRKASK
ncbi:MAG TPA: RNA-binding cell elongation regulator Jag/EloR [Deltaproteobacteria bacterium]|nr:RNA-binding cell elongation regulator Jag/EloR [Deltaproteobacteria bacterium]